MVATRARRYSPESSNIAPEEPSLSLDRLPLELKLMIVDYLLPVNTYVKFRAYFVAHFHDLPRGEKPDLSKLTPWEIVVESLESVLKIAKALLPTTESNAISSHADHNIAEMILNGVEAILLENPDEEYGHEPEQSMELHDRIIENMWFTVDVGFESNEICRALAFVPCPRSYWHRHRQITYHLSEKLGDMPMDELEEFKEDYSPCWKGRKELKRVVSVLYQTFKGCKEMLNDAAEARVQLLNQHEGYSFKGREDLYEIIEVLSKELSSEDMKDL